MFSRIDERRAAEGWHCGAHHVWRYDPQGFTNQEMTSLTKILSSFQNKSCGALTSEKLCGTIVVRHD
jgi:hypothetical protein